MIWRHRICQVCSTKTTFDEFLQRCSPFKLTNRAVPVISAESLVAGPSFQHWPHLGLGDWHPQDPWRDSPHSPGHRPRPSGFEKDKKKAKWTDQIKPETPRTSSCFWLNTKNMLTKHNRPKHRCVMLKSKHVIWCATSGVEFPAIDSRLLVLAMWFDHPIVTWRFGQRERPFRLAKQSTAHIYSGHSRDFRVELIWSYWCQYKWLQNQLENLRLLFFLLQVGSAQSGYKHQQQTSDVSISKTNQQNITKVLIIQPLKNI